MLEKDGNFAAVHHQERNTFRFPFTVSKLYIKLEEEETVSKFGNPRQMRYNESKG